MTTNHFWWLALCLTTRYIVIHRHVKESIIISSMDPRGAQVPCLFGHADTTLIETISASDLAAAYQERLGVSVSNDLGATEEISFRQCNVCLLKFFTPLLAGSEELYLQLARKSWYYSEEKDEFRLAARRIRADQNVLEIGCGTGKFASYLKGGRYMGIELNRNAVVAARAKGLDVRCADVSEIALEQEGKFDVVCSFQVLEHVPEPANFLRSCLKCLRANGLLIIGVPNADAYLGVQPDELLNMPPHHLSWWREETFWRVGSELRSEVIAIESTPLTDKTMYVRVLILNALRRKLGSRQLFFFSGLRYQLLNTVAKVIATGIARHLWDSHLLPRGHSILAVLRKS